MIYGRYTGLCHIIPVYFQKILTQTDAMQKAAGGSACPGAFCRAESGKMGMQRSFTRDKVVRRTLMIREDNEGREERGGREEQRPGETRAGESVRRRDAESATPR